MIARRDFQSGMCPFDQTRFEVQCSFETRNEAPMAKHPPDENWLSIAEQASREMDPVKLTTLVAKLCRALDREHTQKPQFPATGRSH